MQSCVILDSVTYDEFNDASEGGEGAKQLFAMALRDAVHAIADYQQVVQMWASEVGATYAAARRRARHTRLDFWTDLIVDHAASRARRETVGSQECRESQEQCIHS